VNRQTTVAGTIERLGIQPALADIGAYIARQRWSGAMDREPVEVVVEDVAQLRDADPVLLFCIVRLGYADGSATRYALPLGLRTLGDPLEQRAPDFMIGRVGSGESTRLLYDAMGDSVYVHWFWNAIRDSRSAPTERGSIRCAPLGATPVPPDDAPSVRMLAVEQSNTSLVVGEEHFFKHLRRMEEGPSQELEMAEALMRAGFEHAVPVLGAALHRRDTIESPVVLIQPFLHNATEGWALALTSLRDLYADAEEQDRASSLDVHLAVDDQGGAFVAESARLGAVTAGLHVALAQPGLGTDFDATPMTAAALNRWADAMTADLDALLRSPAPSLDPLRDVRSAVVERFDALRALDPGGLCTRVHGDLHLGQMLRVSSGWMILDFEGEPKRTPAERRERSSPLRDVAGMLRSFDYAAAVALAERARPDSDEWEAMMVFGDAWALANREAFWAAYLDAASLSLLPAPGASTVVRRAFEVQKAVYEVAYEMSHRPTWINIPLRFLLRGAL
jgi:maltokinase